MIDVRVICDSQYSGGPRLTTFQLRYPRWIHSEVMTHRMFSRSASSSRAIPVRKIIDDIVHDPAQPVWWGKNAPGMQALEPLTGWRRWLAKRIFFGARYPAIAAAWMLNKIGLHKQLANRILEPWAHISVVITATEWENFFNLRRHRDAQPEIRELAEAMWRGLQMSIPQNLMVHEWHLPYITEDEYNSVYYAEQREPHLEATGQFLWYKDAIKCSVARCARVSFANHGTGQMDHKKDWQLADRLLRSGHMSPFEHQARPGAAEQWYGNFRGWKQFRKQIPGEDIYYRSR